MRHEKRHVVHEIRSVTREQDTDDLPKSECHERRHPGQECTALIAVLPCEPERHEDGRKNYRRVLRRSDHQYVERVVMAGDAIYRIEKRVIRRRVSSRTR